MRIEAYILIGGRSTRLGRAKAFADVGGTTLARRALETVRDSGIACKITFVAGSQTQFAIEAVTLDAPFIFDLIPGRGPLGGLHAALSYSQTPWVFLLACDYPLVTHELIGFLAGGLPDSGGAVVPEQADGRLQPLCAFYNTAMARPLITKTIERPRVPPPMSDLVQKLDPAIVKFSDYSHLPNADSLFLNVNTIDELEAVRGML